MPPPRRTRSTIMEIDVRYYADAPTKEELEDLKRGLHVAMENLINQKDYDEAERVLRQLDQRLVSLINEIVVR